MHGEPVVLGGGLHGVVAHGGVKLVGEAAGVGAEVQDLVVLVGRVLGERRHGAVVVEEAAVSISRKWYGFSMATPMLSQPSRSRLVTILS